MEQLDIYRRRFAEVSCLANLFLSLSSLLDAFSLCSK